MVWLPWLQFLLLVGAAYSVLNPFDWGVFSATGLNGYAAVILTLGMIGCALLLEKKPNTKKRISVLFTTMFIVGAAYATSIGTALVMFALAVASMSYLLVKKNDAFKHYVTFNGAGFVIAGAALAFPAFQTVLLLLAFALLLGLFPFQNWLLKLVEEMDGHTAATIVGPMLGAVLVLTAKFMPLLNGEIIVLMGGVTAVVGLVLALVEKNPKRGLGAASMAETGLVFAFIGSGAWLGAALVLFADVFAKAVLFTAHEEKDDLGMAVGLLSLGALPVSASFFGKMLDMHNPGFSGFSEVIGLLLMIVCLRYLPGGKQKYNPSSFALSMFIVGLGVISLFYLWATGVIA